MKSLRVLSLLALLSNSAFAQMGGVIGSLGGKANCTATYAVTESGVFGPNSKTETATFKGKSIAEACQKAKEGNDSSSGVFGNDYKTLASLSCIIKFGVSVPVDVETCEPKL